MNEVFNLFLADFNFSKLLLFILIYFFIVWLFICLLIYFDAKRRYKKNFVFPIFLLLFLIPFNFPVLMIYILVRPEKLIDYVEDVNINKNFFDKYVVDVPIVKIISNNNSIDKKNYYNLFLKIVIDKDDNIHTKSENFSYNNRDVHQNSSNNFQKTDKKYSIIKVCLNYLKKFFNLKFKNFFYSIYKKLRLSFIKFFNLKKSLNKNKT